MPKVLPQKIKSTAYQLYMQGTPITQIYEKLLEEFPNEKFVRSTVYSWPKAFRWDEDKNEVRVKAKEQIIESEGQRIARLQKEHLDEYEQIREKAKVELAGLEFNSGEGAAKTLDMGIQGQRKVMEGMINLSFVQEILGVLVEEIEDKELLGKISLRLKGIVQESENAKQ
jgi:hypothetical protein|tara:strand:- start:1154 stop:1663 length:510 start_codon:yes stop_codon:yes gene_type:complete